MAPLKTPGIILIDEKVKPGKRGKNQKKKPNKIEVSHHVQPGKRDKNQKEKPEKLKANYSCPAVRGTNQLEHYEHDRPLTLRELMRLQGFPDHYTFTGSHTEIRRQVGNAVPVELATALANAIHQCYESKDEWGRICNDPLANEPEDPESSSERRTTM